MNDEDVRHLLAIAKLGNQEACWKVTDLLIERGLFASPYNQVFRDSLVQLNLLDEAIAIRRQLASKYCAKRRLPRWLLMLALAELKRGQFHIRVFRLWYLDEASTHVYGYHYWMKLLGLEQRASLVAENVFLNGPKWVPGTKPWRDIHLTW